MREGPTPIECNACGIVFHVPELWRQGRVDSGKDFFCPNGHSLVYNKGKSKADRLAEELSAARQRLAEKQDQLIDMARQRDEWRRSSASHKGRANKLAKRISHGVCPCCNRSFANMARHMKTKHPDFNVVPFKAESA